MSIVPTNIQTITIRNKNSGVLETYNAHTGELIFEEGVPKETRPVPVYTIQLGDAIANLVREGEHISKLHTKGFPDAVVIHKWRRLYPEFDEKLKHAREDRALELRDKAEALIEACVDKDDVAIAKFKFDSYLRLAEKDNAREFGSQTKITGDSSAPLQIIVNTGIIRSSDVENSTHIGKQQTGGSDARRVETIDGEYTVRDSSSYGESADAEEDSQEEGEF